MVLSEYPKKDISQKQLSDILVQIMNLYLYSQAGHGVICPDNIIINDNPGSESIGTVSFGDRTEYSDLVYPVPNNASEEKNDVFCLGITAVYMLGGACDLTEAELLLLNIEEDTPFILCPPVKDNEFCALISRMTDINAKTRPSMLECLKTISGFQDGESEIVITDKMTGEALDRIVIRLTDAVSKFYPQNLYEFHRRRYIPEEMPKSGFVPVYYSVYPHSIPFYVTLDRPNPDNMTVSCKAERLCIGVDFGTFSSSASFINDSGRTESIIFDGTDYTPSAVFFSSESQMLFGSEAISNGLRNPESLSTEIKRKFCMGEKINTVSHNTGTVIEKHSSDIVSAYLAYIKSNIEKRLGDTQNAHYVLTVPACFDAGQKTALVSAANRVGIQPDILTEPEAAAIYFGAAAEANRRIMVFDLGGGTLDVSVLISETRNGIPSYRIKRRTGEEELGGADFTKALCKHLCKKVYKKYGINVEADSYESSGLDKQQFEYNRRIMLETAEIIKCELSRYEKSVKTIGLFRAGSASQSQVTISCDREDYEINVIESTGFIAKMRTSVGKAITECGYSPSDIDELIITGGAAQTPRVRRLLTEFFREYNCQINYIDHFSAVSKGAAIYANNLETNNHSAQILPETDYDIGVLVSGKFGSQTMFTPIIRAGTKFDEGVINTHTPCNLTSEEKQGRFCKLVLYRRPRGFESVNSPLEHDGDVIRPIGALYVDRFPEAFDPEKGRVHFTISLNAQECISANVAFFMPSFGGLFGRKEVSEKRLELCTALFIPKGQDD